MPPGYLQIAGGYYMIESGSCGGARISTKSECEAAATALDLSDQTASDYTSSTGSYHPPDCSFVSTMSECDAAATALDLSDQTAGDQTGYTSSSYPQGCVWYSSSALYVFAGGNTGSCSSSQQCICMFTPPSPPSPPS